MVTLERQFAYQLVPKKDVEDKPAISRVHSAHSTRILYTQFTRFSVACIIIGFLTLFLGYRLWYVRHDALNYKFCAEVWKDCNGLQYTVFL